MEAYNLATALASDDQQNKNTNVDVGVWTSTIKQKGQCQRRKSTKKTAAKRSKKKLKQELLRDEEER